jgi:hypothetical protein
MQQNDRASRIGVPFFIPDAQNRGVNKFHGLLPSEDAHAWQVGSIGASMLE